MNVLTTAIYLKRAKITAILKIKKQEYRLVFQNIDDLAKEMSAATVFDRTSNRRSQCCQGNTTAAEKHYAFRGLELSLLGKKKSPFSLRGLPTSLSRRSLRVFPPLDSTWLSTCNKIH